MDTPGATCNEHALDPAEESRLLKNWHVLSAVFSANHACASTALLYASTLLHARVGYVGSALLYVFTCLGALFVGIPLIAAVGQRMSLCLAMAAYSAYVGFFALAIACEAASTGQWLAFLPASCLGGLGAGVLWVVQGGYLSRSADLTAETSEGGRQSATARHATIFAVYYLACEVLLKLATSAAMQHCGQPRLVILVLFGASAVAALVGLAVRELPAGPRQASAPVLAALALWPDPVVWCLSPLNLAFGFSAAFMNGYVNATYTKPQLGEYMVGYLGAATSLLAALLSPVFGAAAVRMGTKGPVLLLGSLSFTAIPVLMLTCGFDGWKTWLVVPYVLQGAGRSVYESTNRGIFADFFPGARSEGAFANLMMQSTLSFAVCFFFSATLKSSILVIIILVLAALAFPGYLVAAQCRRGGRELEGDLCSQDPEDLPDGATSLKGPQPTEGAQLRPRAS